MSKYNNNLQLHSADLQINYRDGEMVTLFHRQRDSKQIFIHVKKIHDRPFVLTSATVDFITKSHVRNDCAGSKFASYLIDEAGGVLPFIFALAEKSTPRPERNGDILAASSNFGMIMGGDSLMQTEHLEHRYGLSVEESLKKGIIFEEARNIDRAGCLLVERQISDYVGLQTTKDAQIALEPVAAWRMQNYRDCDTEIVAMWQHIAQKLNIDIQCGFRIVSAYPGRVAPKVPGDPSLKRAPSPIVDESMKFWREHVMLQTSILSF